MFILFVLVVFGLGYWLGNSARPRDPSFRKTPPDNHDQTTIRNVLDNSELSAQAKLSAIAEIVGTTWRSTDADSEPRADDDHQPAVPEVAERPVDTDLTAQADKPQPSEPFIPSLSRSEQLLYFGAFLFVTSAGLFAAFADVGGVLRTFLIAVVAMTMYASGMYLYLNTARLRTVGEAFSGIGMVMLPLVGVASYSYIFDQQQGALIWAATSIVALGLYALTIIKLRTTFTAYLLIGGFVSSMLSLVGIVEGPLYAFVWMLIISGLAMQLISFYSQKIPPLQTAYKQLSQLFVPLSVLLSLFAIGESGSGQLGVTLLLSSLFYVIQMRTEPSNRSSYLGLAHGSAISGLALIAYGFATDVVHAAVVLLAVSLGHIVCYLLNKLPPQTLANTALVAHTVGLVLLLGQPWWLLAGLLLMVVHGALYARHYQRDLGVTVAGSSWLLVSLVVGQALIEPQLDVAAQLWLSSAFIAAMTGVCSLLQRRDTADKATDSLQQLCLVALGLLLVVSFVLAGAETVLYLGVVWYALLMLARWYSADHWWTLAAYVAIYTPLVYALLAHTARDLPEGYLTITTVVALVASIAAALIVHRSWHRWVSSFCWLLLPYAWLFDQLPGSEHTLWTIIIGYVVVGLCLALSRAIARGRVLRSDNLTVQSLTRSQSISYSIGFATAMTIVTTAALVGSSSATTQTVWLAVVMLLIVGYGALIEQSRQYWAAVPLYLQLVLLRVLLPIDGQALITTIDYQVLLPLLSSLLAVTTMLIVVQRQSTNRLTTTVASWMLFLAPAMVLLFGVSTWPMPLGLVVAAGTLLLLRPELRGNYGELLGLVATFGLSWTLLHHGVDSWVLHSHLYAALAALYAVIYHRRADVERSDHYETLAWLALTVPVIIAALVTDDNYGLLLIVEQALVFVIGVLLSRKRLSRWSIYTALAAILYQLRDLGWAMLAVLSLFIISIAIYHALRDEEQSDDAIH